MSMSRMRTRPTGEQLPQALSRSRDLVTCLTATGERWFEIRGGTSGRSPHTAGADVRAHAARASVGRRDLLAMLRADPGYRFAHPGYVCYWLKMKNSDATAVKREAEEDWGR